METHDISHSCNSRAEYIVLVTVPVPCRSLSLNRKIEIRKLIEMIYCMRAAYNKQVWEDFTRLHKLGVGDGLARQVHRAWLFLNNTKRSSIESKIDSNLFIGREHENYVVSEVHNEDYSTRARIMRNFAAHPVILCTAFRVYKDNQSYYEEFHCLCIRQRLFCESRAVGAVFQIEICNTLHWRLRSMTAVIRCKCWVYILCRSVSPFPALLA